VEGFPGSLGPYNSLSPETSITRKKEPVMLTEALKCVKKNMGNRDVTRECGHGTLEIATIEDTTLARVTLQPGWKWSEHIRPMVNTDSCQAHHAQYVISGRLTIAMDDGSKTELKPGDFACIPAGHDAWVVGNEPFVAIDFSPDMRQYAQESDSCRS
jgi:quercetin dioxygenase-like cupin family protein